MWLICQAAPGRKSKLLVRGIEGAEWVFCPFIKGIKRNRVGINRCQGCKHFIRFEQTYVPQAITTRKTLSFRVPTLSGVFYAPRTLGRLMAPHLHSTLFPPISGLTRERGPLIDIFEEEDYITVLAELPGVNEKDINIKTDENTLTITAENTMKKYLQIVRLPAPIEKDRIKFTYKNNILQVRLRKLRAKKHD